MYTTIGSPVFAIYPTDVTVVEGDTVMFRCLATATPFPTVAWIFNDTVLSYGAKYQLGSDNEFGTLTIQNPTFDDRGRYRCVYNNTLGSVTASAYLSVQGNYMQQVFWL